MNYKLIREHIIIPSLTAINSYSDEACALVLETGMCESGYRAVRQSGGGPALGYWQMERATHDDIFKNYLGGSSRKHLLDGLHFLSDRVGDYKELEVNPFYAAAMCRIHYLRSPKPIPKTRQERAELWKSVYNTPMGKGSPGEYLERTTPLYKV